MLILGIRSNHNPQGFFPEQKEVMLFDITVSHVLSPVFEVLHLRLRL